ncbi:glycosyltransferase [Rubrivirga sp. S365]|uniref:Glycosyltransferase n=1 Tax=Rubrivirga litoralis TaxID=3075598 RepID=A0ABU3BTI4_9BACT|nr:MULTISPECIES: glycosyltransferase [unclassified Rubrivirga]MDT0632611.1 glycosyltransferase [Rubrivirga sp. F394]MDT7855433.1 glycosyltransferase [Rubrivirga sp. S365]
MTFALFYHSLLSDWNHGNAHFLRGVVSELVARGHDVTVWEPEDAWSLQNLRAEHGEGPVEAFLDAYPQLRGISRSYDPATLDLDEALGGADAVVVHEWSDHDLVARVGRHRRGAGYRLLFHDTHHRAVTEPETMGAYDLSGFDGVLAFGDVLRRLYLDRGWAERAWTWHEAADTRFFYPREAEREGDLVWVGNWGDEERTAELHEFLLDPVEALGLSARVHGVRYPEHARAALAAAGIEYGGWLPSADVPRTLAQFGVTVHVPRRPYVEALPGIPTIRPFETLACGIPLVCSPWDDAEGLFTPGEDFLIARDGAEMQRHLRDVLHDPSLAASLRAHGLATIRARHTCAHRVDELDAILAELGVGGVEPAAPKPAAPPERGGAISSPQSPIPSP